MTCGEARQDQCNPAGTASVVRLDGPASRPPPARPGFTRFPYIARRDHDEGIQLERSEDRGDSRRGPARSAACCSRSACLRGPGRRLGRCRGRRGGGRRSLCRREHVQVGRHGHGRPDRRRQRSRDQWHRWRRSVGCRPECRHRGQRRGRRPYRRLCLDAGWRHRR